MRKAECGWFSELGSITVGAMKIRVSDRLVEKASDPPRRGVSGARSPVVPGAPDVAVVSSFLVGIVTFFVLVVLPLVLAETVEQDSGKKGLKWAIVRLICMLFKCLASILASGTVSFLFSMAVNPVVRNAKSYIDQEETQRAI